MTRPLLSYILYAANFHCNLVHSKPLFLARVSLVLLGIVFIFRIVVVVKAMTVDLVDDNISNRRRKHSHRQSEKGVKVIRIEVDVSQ